MYKNTDLLTNQILAQKKMYLKYRTESQKRKWEFHSHNGFEIYYFQKGMANYIIGDAIYTLAPGDMLVFNGQILHRANPSADVPYIRSFINFLPSYFAQLIEGELSERILEMLNNPNGQLIRWEEAERSEIEKLLFHLFTEQEKEVVGHEFMMRAYFTQLVMKMYRNVRELELVEENNTISQKEAHVQRILAFINHNYQENITLDAIAEAVFLNKHYICHCFKEVTGFTINKYTARRRVDEAKRMLRTTNKSVGHIAEQIGLGNTAQLSRLFKVHEGISPQVYRKMYRNSDESKI